MPREVSRSLGRATHLNFMQGRPHPGSPLRRALQPLRFLVCGDLRLTETCHPVRGLPEELESRLLRAPYTAARQVVDLAIIEQVDFVLLNGPLFSETACGVKEPVFLSQQFQKLCNHSIPVIWAKTSVAPDTAWQAWLSWPNGVFEIDATVRQTYHFDKEGRDSAIVSTSIPTTVPKDDEPSVKIGVVPHRIKADANHDDWRDFDLLVSVTGPYTVADDVDHSIPAEFAQGIGPQGRSFDEYGPHGCWLVSIDASRHAQVDFVPCDVIRWRREVAEINDETTWSQLLENCVTQSQRARSSGHALTFIKWQLIGHGHLCRELWETSRMQQFHQELQQSLQAASIEDCRLWIAEADLVFDPREEARLRSEQRAWAAWSTAIDEYESARLQPPTVADDTSRPHPHFQQIRRKALRRLIQHVGEE